VNLCFIRLHPTVTRWHGLRFALFRWPQFFLFFSSSDSLCDGYKKYLELYWPVLCRWWQHGVISVAGVRCAAAVKNRRSSIPQIRFRRYHLKPLPQLRYELTLCDASRAQCRWASICSVLQRFCASVKNGVARFLDARDEESTVTDWLVTHSFKVVQRRFFVI